MSRCLAERSIDHARARKVPSLQLAGHPDYRAVDLNALAAIGVRLVGRLAGISDRRVQFSGAPATMPAS